jgi:hypothetical protein
MLEYFAYKKLKRHRDHPDRPDTPILNEADEQYLQRIISEPEGPRPPLPARPQDLPEAGDASTNNMQVTVMDEPRDIPLPDVADTPEGVMPAFGHEDVASPTRKGEGKEKSKHKEGHRSKWSFLRRDSRDVKRKNQIAAGTDLQAVADGVKSPGAKPNEDGIVTPGEANKEEQEMSAVLEQLNLAAVNNRVFSISDESKELMRKFTLVLKDLVNGVPTAYSDLESLITNSENQLQSTYKHLPSFLQDLISKLPEKFTSSLGPEILAATAAKSGSGLASKADYITKGASIANKMGMKVKVPNLKDLVTKPGAIAGLLKAIMNFLRARFPAFMGMNVLWSLALFVLLFVFWYCHKRGREVRLEKERLMTQAEIDALAAEIAADPPADFDPANPMTVAPEGATMGGG